MENISPSDQGFTHKVSWWRGHFDQNHKTLHENSKNNFFWTKQSWGGLPICERRSAKLSGDLLHARKHLFDETNDAFHE